MDKRQFNLLADYTYTLILEFLKIPGGSYFTQSNIEELEIIYQAIHRLDMYDFKDLMGAPKEIEINISVLDRLSLNFWFFAKPEVYLHHLINTDDRLDLFYNKFKTRNPVKFAEYEIGLLERDIKILDQLIDTAIPYEKHLLFKENLYQNLDMAEDLLFNETKKDPFARPLLFRQNITSNTNENPIQREKVNPFPQIFDSLETKELIEFLISNMGEGTDTIAYIYEEINRDIEDKKIVCNKKKFQKYLVTEMGIETSKLKPYHDLRPESKRPLFNSLVKDFKNRSKKE